MPEEWLQWPPPPPLTEESTGKTEEESTSIFAGYLALLLIGVVVVVGGFLWGVLSDWTNPDKPGPSAPSDTNSTFYAERACADFQAIVEGINDRTMTMSDIIAKLGKMAINTQDAEDADGSGWASLNLNTKQLRAAAINNDLT